MYPNTLAMGNIVSTLVHSSVCPSISLSCYLLQNHWGEFNQTCYMTSPCGKNVQEWVCPLLSPSRYLLFNH